MTVAGHGLHASLLKFLTQRVDPGGRFSERGLGVLQRLPRAGKAVLKECGLLLERFRLHPDFLELLAREVDFAPVAVAPRPVFGDALLVHADDFTGAGVGAVGGGGLGGERAEALFEGVHIRMDLLRSAFGGVYLGGEILDSLFRLALLLCIAFECEVEVLEPALAEKYV